MFKSFDLDRPFLDAKYHPLDGSFDEKYVKSAHLNTKYGRMAFHGYEYDPATGKTDEEILAELKAMLPELDNYPHPIAKAKAIKYVLENTRIDVNEHDYFIGIYSWDRLCRKVTVSRWDQELFATELADVKDKFDDFNNSGLDLFWPDYDHVVVDWLAVMDLGLPGLLERARDYKARFEAEGKLDEEKRTYFSAIEIEYSAIITFVDRLYRYALTQKHAKAPVIAECLKDLHDGAPKSTFEALELMYIFWMIMESVDCYQCRSLGNGLDRTLQKFYDADIASGRYTREEIGEFLAYFLMQFSAIGNYWGQPFYLGGTDSYGNTRVTDLSYLILETYGELGIYNPKVQIKVSPNTPRAFLDQLFKMIRNGQNSFVFCSEENYIKLLMAVGASYEEACDLDISGCYEGSVRGKQTNTSAGNLNLPKALLYALYNGFDTSINKQLGLRTGELAEFATFPDFYNAVIRQLKGVVLEAMRLNNRVDGFLGYVNPSSMYSATVTCSLEKGVDGYQAGSRFNNSSICVAGFATLVDSLMAIKHFVYDEKIVTLAQMREALDANWAGFETLRLQIIRCEHKYGNADAETDLYARGLSDYITTLISNKPNGKGGLYQVEAHSPRFVWQGMKTQATPDGRFAGEELSKNASPVSGMDRTGITALIKSAVAIHPENFSRGGCLDVLLHPSTVADDKGLDIMYSLITMYHANGGPSVHFNIFDAEQLKDAQLHPEKYTGLQVRVCGWNALWNNLTRAEQDSIILRAESICD